MLHKFFEPGDWFAPKKIGYGAGLPIAWQGWVLLMAYIVVMSGFGFATGSGDIGTIVIAASGMVVATLLFLWIAKSRTQGGWRWRNGGD